LFEISTFWLSRLAKFNLLRALLLQADSTPISSCLVESRRGMKRAMLEVVAAGVVASSADVERYLKCRYGRL
jgi:hypothetical protein